MGATVADNLKTVRDRIENAKQRSGRAGTEVLLVAVSKKVEAARLREAYVAGQRHFGENYIQEALAKQSEVRDLAIEWHAVGAVQSNKIRDVVRNFQWFHGLGSRSQATELAKQLKRPEAATSSGLHVFLQLNLADEPTKSGLKPDEIEPFVYHLEELAAFQVSGLMTIPPPAENEAAARAHFAAVRNMAERLNSLKLRWTQVHQLSMGMSADYEAAVAEGATVVRVGEAIFGPRLA